MDQKYQPPSERFQTGGKTTGDRKETKATSHRCDPHIPALVAHARISSANLETSPVVQVCQNKISVRQEAPVEIWTARSANRISFFINARASILHTPSPPVVSGLTSNSRVGGLNLARRQSGGHTRSGVDNNWGKLLHWSDRKLGVSADVTSLVNSYSEVRVRRSLSRFFFRSNNNPKKKAPYTTTRASAKLTLICCRQRFPLLEEICKRPKCCTVFMKALTLVCRVRWAKPDQYKPD